MTKIPASDPQTPHSMSCTLLGVRRPPGVPGGPSRGSGAPLGLGCQRPRRLRLRSVSSPSSFSAPSSFPPLSAARPPPTRGIPASGSQLTRPSVGRGVICPRVESPASRRAAAAGAGEGEGAEAGRRLPPTPGGAREAVVLKREPGKAEARRGEVVSARGAEGPHPRLLQGPARPFWRSGLGKGALTPRAGTSDHPAPAPP